MLMLSKEIDYLGKEGAAHQLHGRGGWETEQPIIGQGETVQTSQATFSSLGQAFLPSMPAEEEIKL